MFRVVIPSVIAALMASSVSAVMGSDRCTTITMGKSATADGSTMTTYNMDCAECDWRVNKVPAMDHPEGSLRPIYLLTSTYPRQVRTDRGFTWSPQNLENLPQRSQWEQMTGTIIGHIPQVNHTYALLEGGYGIMNEFQVTIGESTCPAKVWAAPITQGGDALLEVSELSQIALERCTTARCAVELMGSLAEQYGYYSGEWDPNNLDDTLGEAGEALTVADPNEAWMFHIVADDTKRSAVWVAQRVPDDHITVVANQFVIRDVLRNSSDFLYSSNLWDVAERLGFWSPADGELNFLKVYSVERDHPQYATRRVWRVMSLAAPSANLPGDTNPWGDDYPFSIKVDFPLTLDWVLRVLRDHYEGTPYSLTEGRASGPYGDPNRWDLGDAPNITYDEEMPGSFERAISIMRTSYSFVGVSRNYVPDLLGHVWLSQYAPAAASYTPLYVASERLPEPFIRGAMQQYTNESAWWNFCAVGNYAGRFYVFTIGAIQALQQQLQWQLGNATSTLESRVMLMANAAVGAQVNTDGTLSSSSTPGWVSEAVDLITDCTVSSGVQVSKAWRDFLPTLFSTYRDGQIFVTNQTAIHRKSMFYPEWWLTLVGYWNIPGNPNGIYFEPNPQSDVKSRANGLVNKYIPQKDKSNLSASTMFAGVAVICLGFAAGRYSSVVSRRKQYIPL